MTAFHPSIPEAVMQETTPFGPFKRTWRAVTGEWQQSTPSRSNISDCPQPETRHSKGVWISARTGPSTDCPLTGEDIRAADVQPSISLLEFSSRQPRAASRGCTATDAEEADVGVVRPCRSIACVLRRRQWLCCGHLTSLIVKHDRQQQLCILQSLEGMWLCLF